MLNLHIDFMIILKSICAAGAPHIQRTNRLHDNPEVNSATHYALQDYIPNSGPAHEDSTDRLQDNPEVYNFIYMKYVYRYIYINIYISIYIYHYIPSQKAEMPRQKAETAGRTLLAMTDRLQDNPEVYLLYSK